jgi:hypothetical protein
LYGVHAPPRVVMVAPQTLLRNAERVQSIGRAKEDVATRRGQGQYKGRSTIEPHPGVLEEPQ